MSQGLYYANTYFSLKKTLFYGKTTFLKCVEYIEKCTLAKLLDSSQMPTIIGGEKGKVILIVFTIEIKSKCMPLIFLRLNFSIQLSKF